MVARDLSASYRRRAIAADLESAVWDSNSGLVAKLTAAFTVSSVAWATSTAAISNCYYITQFRRIDSGKGLGIHDSPSLFEALPGPSKQPSSEGESAHL
jgi:hypothetical protein